MGSITVHPRIRGERQTSMKMKSFNRGSSPHTRGTPGPLEFTRPAARFIPAYAGNAYQRDLKLVPTMVHPRIRGERLVGIQFPGETLGSSPHTRGTQILLC